MTRSKTDVGVLFVCTGNICRSPTAEGVLRHRLVEEGLDGRVAVDSAGLGDWHVGDPPSPRAIDRAGARVIGLDLIYPTSLDRPDLLRGYDKPLLKALFTAGRAGDLVLGQVRLSQQKIAPHPSQVIAAGGGANLRTLNLIDDRDRRRFAAEEPAPLAARR